MPLPTIPATRSFRSAGGSSNAPHPKEQHARAEAAATAVHGGDRPPEEWSKELDYRLRKELFTFRENRIAVRFEYESHDPSGQWWRSYGIELWEFADDGRMARRTASINDVPIDESEHRNT